MVMDRDLVYANQLDKLAMWEMTLCHPEISHPTAVKQVNSLFYTGMASYSLASQIVYFV